ncbi:MAG: 4-hydroxythreonine-4-phosphate dehydrogenase PdxA [Hyphomicrobiaceae bacterium]
MSSNPPIAITMGDPAGIGPEIAVKVAADRDLPIRPVIIGDFACLEQAAKIANVEQNVIEINSLASFDAESDLIQVLQVRPALSTIESGRVSAECGQAAYDYIRAAINLAKASEVSAVVTAPIHKEALAAAGIAYPGHTEMLADFGGAERCAMMLANDELRVVLVTIHCALREAIEKITVESEFEAISLAHEGAREFGIAQPRVAVAGLNPHAGEGGLFGNEEADVIVPAINAARDLGIDVSGPWPGDTVFMQARAGRFDVVVAQYHDQGLIPIKYLGIENGVNITLGLPFVRTSPDHGTAFDIAGKGIADPASLRMAVIQAHRLAVARKGQHVP